MMIVNIGEYVEIDENHLFCKICDGALSIDDKSWSYVCPKNHSYRQDTRGKWCREGDKMQVKKRIATYEFIRECWVNKWDLDTDDLLEILKENFNNVRKAHTEIPEEEVKKVLKLADE